MDLLPLNILWAGPEKAAEVDNSVRLLTDSTAVQAKVMGQPVYVIQRKVIEQGLVRDKVGLRAATNI